MLIIFIFGFFSFMTGSPTFFQYIYIFFFDPILFLFDLIPFLVHPLYTICAIPIYPIPLTNPGRVSQAAVGGNSQYNRKQKHKPK